MVKIKSPGTVANVVSLLKIKLENLDLKNTMFITPKRETKYRGNELADMAQISK